MNRIVFTTNKVILTLLSVTPILGTLGIFPEPTRDMYHTDQAYTFISALMESGYINPIMAVVFAGTVVLLWTRREAASALLVLPLTVNIVAFHLFLDGGVFTPGAIMADVLLLLNLYFLWHGRGVYRTLFAPRTT